MAFSPSNRPIDVQHYCLTMDIDPRTDPVHFDAAAEIRIKALKSVRQFSLDIEELSIKDIEVKHPANLEVQFSTTKTGTSEQLEIALSRGIKAGTLVTLLVNYRGKIRTSHNGLFKVKDPDEPDRGVLLFTHFEALSARAFFPSNDEPYDKATSEVRVILPEKYDAISNGRKTLDKKFKRLNEYWREILWSQEKPHSTYLVSLAIAPFSAVNDSPKKPEINVWVGKSKTEKARYAVGVTRAALDYFEDYLGTPYPWHKYDTVGLPTFLWGGMENTSSTHMNQERTLLNDPSSEFEKKRVVALAAHELAHQWFGDSVTMKWWDDLWLNESFASRMETLATKHILKTEESEIDLIMTTWEDYFREENGPRSHPIISRELGSVDDAFDSTNYTKGENVLKMLSFYMGEENFKKSLKEYLKRYRHSNATYLDFFSIAERVSRQRLSRFRDSWLLQRGYPLVTYSGTWEPNTKKYSLTLKQQSNHKGERSLFVFKVPITLHRKTNPAYALEKIMTITSPEHTLRVSLLAPPEWVSVNTGGSALIKVVRPSPDDEETLGLQAIHDPDLYSRLAAGYDLSRGLLDGFGISENAERMLFKMIAIDPSPYLRCALLSVFKKIKTHHLPDQLGNGIFELAQKVQDADYEGSPLFIADPHGWRQFRSQLFGVLGKINRRQEIIAFVKQSLGRANLPLDDLGEAAISIAQTGDPSSAEILKKALKIHGPRGYRYTFSILYAFGAFENPNATAEIRWLSENYGSDLMGRIGWLVRDNYTLKSSPEWASFLQDFLIKSERFGDEVKARVLQTIEEVKTPHVKNLLESVAQGSSSERLRTASKKILDKNFSRSVSGNEAMIAY